MFIALDLMQFSFYLCVRVLMHVMCLYLWDLGKSAKAYIHAHIHIGIQIHVYAPKSGNQTLFQSGKDDDWFDSQA